MDVQLTPFKTGIFRKEALNNSAWLCMDVHGQHKFLVVEKLAFFRGNDRMPSWR